MTSTLQRLPVGAGPASPAQVGRALLSWVESWWEDRADPQDPDAPQPLPPARYLAGGDPRTVAWDHDDGQVTVALDRLVSGLDPTVMVRPSRSPRQSPANVGTLTRHAVYEVQIVRPSPGLTFAGSIPGGTAIDAHGYLTMSDQGHLLRCLADAARAGVLLRENVGQGNIIIGDGESLGPSGSLAATACGVQVSLL